MKRILFYGTIAGLLILLLKVAEYRFWIRDHSLEWYSGALAIIFTLLGAWAGIKFLTGHKESFHPPQQTSLHPPTEINQDEMLKKFGISKRELEVLVLIEAGCSNQEIADRLFVSLNTVKTHSSRLFEKLEVKRRTQAVQKAKELQIIS